MFEAVLVCSFQPPNPRNVTNLLNFAHSKSVPAKLEAYIFYMSSGSRYKGDKMI